MKDTVLLSLSAGEFVAWNNRDRTVTAYQHIRNLAEGEQVFRGSSPLCVSVAFVVHIAEDSCRGRLTTRGLDKEKLCGG